MDTDDELIGRMPSTSMTMDRDLKAVYLRAARSGRNDRHIPPISFTVVLLALLEGADETSRWFAGQAATLGPVRARVRETIPISSPSAESRAINGLDPPLFTRSSRAVLSCAEEWAHSVGASEIGVRHLIAAYVLNPPSNHRKQLQEWGTQEAQWAAVFYAYVAERFSWERWSEQQYVPKATRLEGSSPDREPLVIKRSELAWPGDSQALAVLAAATDAHRAAARTGWLSTRKLVIAMTEMARVLGAECLSPFVVVADTEPYTRVKQDAGLAGWNARPRHELASDEADLSPQLANILETARLLAAGAWPGRPQAEYVGLRHLVGAVASLGVDASEELVAVGIDPAKLRQQIREYVKARHADESLSVWDEVLDPEAAPYKARPTHLNSDEPAAVVRRDPSWTRDPLAARADIESFAALLASRSLEPPLSIGLFGPWGSGKSTFMSRLREAVTRRAETTGDDRADWIEGVVHVEFNAWHYSETDIVASLVEAIFRKLDGFIKGNPTAFESLQERRKELESARRNVAAAQEAEREAKARAAEAERELATARELARSSSAALTAAVGDAWQGVRASVFDDPQVKASGILDAIGELHRSAEELDTRLETLRGSTAAAIRAIPRGWYVALVLMLVATPFLCAWLVKLLSTGEVTEVLATVSGMLAVIAGGLRALARATARVQAAVSKAQDTVREGIESNEGVVAARSVASHAEDTLAQKRAAAEEAARDVVRAELEVANAALPARIAALASERVTDKTYARALGNVALARADFELLSEWLREQRTEMAGTANPSAAPVRSVGRVILYVDDLDRCSPEQVVRVLQVVHMLLAFELFVVVVAVDASWVINALERSYPWLGESAAGGGGGRSPVNSYDYLEKIFQLAFWLEPMSRPRVSSYLASLVRERSTEAAPSSGTTPAQPEWDIRETELHFMRALADCVGVSPRRVKRLVNTYRMIKARLSDPELEVFVTRQGDRSGAYQSVIALLAIATGAPAEAPRLLSKISESQATTTLEALAKEFATSDLPGAPLAKRVLETLASTQGDETPVEELRGWARRVSRYMLHGPHASKVGARADGLCDRPSAQR